MIDKNSRFSMIPAKVSTSIQVLDKNSRPEVSDFLAFVLSQENYALPLSSVREIMKLQYVTEVPLAPSNVMGIISVRGRVTTLVDLRRLLSIPEKKLTSKARVLLVDNGSEVLGFLVDRVLQVYRLSDEEIELAASMGGEQGDYIMGIGRPGLGISEDEIGESAKQQFSNYHIKSSLLREESVVSEILILLDPDTLFKM